MKTAETRMGRYIYIYIVSLTKINTLPTGVKIRSFVMSKNQSLTYNN